MSDGSSYRNINKKKPDGGVGKSAGGLMFVKLISQKEEPSLILLLLQC
jgi:hypothetical protein